MKIIKSILRKGKGVKQTVFKKILPKFFYRTRFLSKCYYLFFDNSFNREMQAVLSGKVKHINDDKVLQANYYMLVRNIHRIEKGLSMRPLRDIFGREFIQETVRSFEGVWNATSDNPQMKWFYDVLKEYFNVVKQGDKIIDGCREKFEVFLNSQITKNAHDMELRSSIPYTRRENEASNIMFEEFYELTKQRRSVRWFLPKKVDRDLIDRAITAANLSPSACNRQPFEFRVIDDADLLKKVVDIPMGTKGYSHTIPVFLVIIGNLDAYLDERDRHVVYIDGSLAAMTLMLALETLGLSSCAINWPDIELKEVEMGNFLSLDTHQRPLMCMGIGYADPDGLVAYSEKRPIETIRKYN